MRRRYLAVLTALLLLLPTAMSRARSQIDFELDKNVVVAYNGVEVGSVTYKIHVPETGHTICTGWRYPVVQLWEDEWPMRRSCRTADFHYIEEVWGGKRFPFPYLGEYEAFVEDYSDNGKLTRVMRKFRVIEGIAQ